MTTYLNAEDIEFSLTNTPQITFEVTDACNLNCTYCGYGEFYSDYDKRENKMLPIDKAIRLLNYINKLWNSPKNISYNRNVYISFYGGEPLLNMNFIKQIVDYLENLNCKSRTFTFSMTTNALLLSKYMDYLVLHNFHILISLDGNKENTAYRLDKNGKEVFDRIINNVNKFKEVYPDYFNKYVNFNAVLHNKNSVESIYTFFKTKFNKMPRIGELNNTGIKEEKKDEFEKAYQNTEISLYQSEHYTEIMKDMALQLGTYQSVSTYIMQYSEFVYKDYNELLYGKRNNENSVPTGTCIPFSKKIFITVNGKLLPCERIGQQFALGNITENEIEVDYDLIAKKYNLYYSKIEKQCKSCYNNRTCIQCIYNLKDIENNPKCHGFMNLKEFERFKSNQLNFLAKNPEEYFRLMEDTIII